MAVLSLLLLGGLWSAVGASNMAVVTCGSVVKLLNTRHNVRLHSHDVRYGSGSGQQSVTGVTSVDDSNSYWRIRGKTATVCERGTPIKCGQPIRLTHINTGRNLHSHHFTSPLSGNQVRQRAVGVPGLLVISSSFLPSFLFPSVLSSLSQHEISFLVVSSRWQVTPIFPFLSSFLSGEGDSKCTHIPQLLATAFLEILPEAPI